VKVADAVPDFAKAFGFEEFNRMQREALPAILDGSDNVVASAPTASGKTALAELAICRTLRDGGTALFIAPMRALTNEKEDEWDRFEELVTRCTSSPASGISTPAAPNAPIFW